MKPKILLATTCRWFSAARLAIAFSDIGCYVEMVGPWGHPAVKTRALRHRYSFRGLAPSASFHAAIKEGQPDVIVPCDDLSAIHLHRLYLDLSQPGETETRTIAVLRRSLGPHTSFPILDSRSNLMVLARSLGVRVPESSVVTKDNLTEWLSRNGLPAVLKADGSAGGRGVQVVRTVSRAQEAFAVLSAPPIAARAIKRALFDQDRTLLTPWIQRRAPVVNAQALVAGRDATISVACWEGEIVAALAVEVIKTQSPGGPSSVLRLIDSPEMSRSAEKIVNKLALSGLLGFDFILGVQNGYATLIEMNARATQICHLPMGTHHDLPVALSAIAGGDPIPATNPISDRAVIALFPQEWGSDPTSAYLSTAYHDVPWQEPRLVKACIDFYTAQRTWYSSRRLTTLYRKFSALSSHHRPIKSVGR
jgi:Carbamoyl-phosphate synthase L chain, ATP binding domain